MTFASGTRFHIYFPRINAIGVKALVGAFNQEKALVRAFSVIVKTDGLFAALIKMRVSSHSWSMSGPHRGLASGEWPGAGVRDDGVLSRGQSQRQHS